jgi:predicted dehydrogenase
MRVGIIGTGAIAHKHVAAYRNIGFEVVACAGLHAERGLAFAQEYGCEFCAEWRDVCRHPRVEFVDVCTFPDFRLEVVEACADAQKHVQVQKPMAISPAIARKMIEVSHSAGIVLGVGSQHRFDDACLFLKKAIDDGRLGRLIEADAYVKWWRSDGYYSRAVKGSWEVEGGGALINQAIHQIDLLLWFAGRVRAVAGEWQLGAAHRIESEDVVNALLRYGSDATGVIQASTAVKPGYPERIEIHGTRGSAVITGDKLTAWDAEGDAPVTRGAMSGASEPMNISTRPFERQFLDFAQAIHERRAPLVSGEEGYRAVELVDAIYRSCRLSRRIEID